MKTNNELKQLIKGAIFDTTQRTVSIHSNVFDNGDFDFEDVQILHSLLSELLLTEKSFGRNGSENKVKSKVVTIKWDGSELNENKEKITIQL